VKRRSIPEQHHGGSLSNSLRRVTPRCWRPRSSVPANRLEILTPCCASPEQGITAVGGPSSAPFWPRFGELTPHCSHVSHAERVSHLDAGGVASGLDSLVRGDGGRSSSQVKKIGAGSGQGALGFDWPDLNRLHPGRSAPGKPETWRTETTCWAPGARSISSAAVELAQLKGGQGRGLDELVSLDQEQVAVVGAGGWPGPSASASAVEGLQGPGSCLNREPLMPRRSPGGRFPRAATWLQCRPLQAISTTFAEQPARWCSQHAQQSSRSSIRPGLQSPTGALADAGDIGASPQHQLRGPSVLSGRES